MSIVPPVASPDARITDPVRSTKTRSTLRAVVLPRIHNELPATATVYCEGNFGAIDGKTANGLVRHSERYEILSIIDSQKAGLDVGRRPHLQPRLTADGDIWAFARVHAERGLEVGAQHEVRRNLQGPPGLDPFQTDQVAEGAG